MERLTKLDGIGQQEIIRCFECNAETSGHMNENCGMCEHWSDVVSKLAKYEEAKEQGLLVEVVRCEDCRWLDKQLGRTAKCVSYNPKAGKRKYRTVHDNDGFCSIGEEAEKAKGAMTDEN